MTDQSENTTSVSDAAKELSDRGASKGGRARASVLSPEERSAIARRAVQTRWSKEKGTKLEDYPTSLATVVPIAAQQTKAELPIALFQGDLKIGAAEYSCYVLNNGSRVIPQREVVRMLTGHAKGNLDRYLDAHYLQAYISKERILRQSIRFMLQGTRNESNGYEATLILDICDAYLQARDAGLTKSRQTRQLARQAEILMRACAKVGIIALVDEATGYQQFRKKQELQIKLQAFIAEEMQEWAKMFPDEFWFELARLEGVHYSPKNRPLRWGKYVMMFVYDAVDPDVGRELRKKNPNPHFLQNHHQWLKTFGRNKVHDQIQKVVTIMKLCNDMDDFRRKFARVFKTTPVQLSFEDISWGQ